MVFAPKPDKKCLSQPTVDQIHPNDRESAQSNKPRQRIQIGFGVDMVLVRVFISQPKERTNQIRSKHIVLSRKSGTVPLNPLSIQLKSQKWIWCRPWRNTFGSSSRSKNTRFGLRLLATTRFELVFCTIQGQRCVCGCSEGPRKVKSPHSFP